MGDLKGVILGIIAALVLFSIIVIFNTEFMDPMVADIGTKGTEMVDSVFTGITSPPDGNIGGN